MVGRRLRKLGEFACSQRRKLVDMAFRMWMSRSDLGVSSNSASNSFFSEVVVDRSGGGLTTSGMMESPTNHS